MQGQRDWLRSIDGVWRTARANTDTNEGRRSAASCPCLSLVVVFEDDRIDADSVAVMLCEHCAATWVREVSPPERD